MLCFRRWLVPGAFALVPLVGCGDDTPSVVCDPADTPQPTEICSPVCNPDGTWSLACCGDPPEPPGCGAFFCQQGIWQYDPQSCFSCPTATPVVGERCDDGARCDYPSACGIADQFDCVGGRWDQITEGCCTRANPPVLGAACAESVSNACTLACDDAETGSTTFLCDDAQWTLLAHAGNAAGCCTLLVEMAACTQVPACRWVAPTGCEPVP